MVEWGNGFSVWFGAKPIPSIPFPPDAGKGKKIVDCFINFGNHPLMACRIAAKASPS